MKLSRRTPGLSLLVSACLLTPAFAGKVKIFPQQLDMAHYKTYRWLPPRFLVKTGLDENNPNNPILKEVVGQQLDLVGLKEVAEGGDLVIQAYVLTTYVPQLEAVLFGEGYNFDYGTVVASMGRYNREGTLFLNLIDRQTKKSAWAGMSTDSLNRGYLSPDAIRSKLEKMTKQVFKKYPVKK